MRRLLRDLADRLGVRPITMTSPSEEVRIVMSRRPRGRWAIMVRDATVASGRRPERLHAEMLATADRLASSLPVAAGELRRTAATWEEMAADG